MKTQSPQSPARDMVMSTAAITHQPNRTNKSHTILKILVLGDSSVGKTSLLHRFDVDKFSGQYKATIGADFCSKHVSLEVNDSTDTSSATNTRECTIQLWDTAGQERFQSLGTSFYRGADACILVYDIGDVTTFQHVDKWRREFLKQVGMDEDGEAGDKNLLSNMSRNNPTANKTTLLGSSTHFFPFILLGNKADKDVSYSTTSSSSSPSDRDGEFSSSSSLISSTPPFPSVAAVPEYIVQDWCIEKNIAFHAYVSAKTGMNVQESFLAAAKYALQRQDLQMDREKSIHVQFSPSAYHSPSSQQRFHIDNAFTGKKLPNGGSCC